MEAINYIPVPDKRTGKYMKHGSNSKAHKVFNSIMIYYM